ncbi:MAG: ABC transporter permease [Gemmatimonadetes bacterium]|nr:ABC transporter permease [Gemmatimonadota bacterium]MDA1103903.1 ABC transporter permease [Gemmatimonadota bacterium]
MTERPRRLFRLPTRREGLRDEVDEELRFHLEECAAKYERAGMSPAEARAEAERRFGDIERVRSDVEAMMTRRQKAMQQSDRIDDLRRDVAFAGRQILSNPGFSSVAVLTIAIAIGATTAIYSVVDGIMFRALPFADADELVMVWADYTRRDVVLPDKRREWLSWPNFSDFRGQVSAVESISAFSDWNPTLTGTGDAQRLSGGVFSHGMFSDVLGVEPALGRGFLPEEDLPGGPVAVILSDGFWRRAFAADVEILGQVIRLNDQPYTVVGIMPPSFAPPPFLGTDAWSLLQFDLSNGGGRGGAFLRAVGRLTDPSALELAQSQARQLGARLEEEYPLENIDTGFNVYPLQFDMVRQTRTALWVLLGAVGFVLLIACVNVANLLLARGATRHGELAVRVAMGAGRRRILAQLVTENLLLALTGGLLGLTLAFIGTNVLVRLAPDGTPLLEQVAVDGRILFFAALVTIVTGALFGVLPAVHASRAQPAVALREGGRGSGAGPSSRLRNTLVVGQVALALMLLVGAGLLVRSFQNLNRVDLGFNPENVLATQIQLSPVGYPDAATRLTFVRSLEAQLSAVPGIEFAGSITNLPLAGADGDTNFFVEGATPPRPGLEPSVWLRRITPGYLDAMGLQLVTGRAFLDSDDPDAPRVIIVNETLQRDYFDGHAVGKRLNVNNTANPVWREIVGVVRDIKNFGVRADSRNAMYLPFAQAPTSSMFTVVRTSVEPTSLVNVIRGEISKLDANIALADVQPMAELVTASLATDRFTTSLLGGFASVALLLAIVGLYGVVSYSVSTRLREMGVRIALGAETRQIRALVLRWALALAAAGIVIGGVGSVAVNRLMEGLLFGVGTTDAVTFGIVSAVMASAAVLASMIPAIRATRVDPIKVLKTD